MFVTLEGCDGSGKTSTLDFLYLILQQLGVEVYRFAEPGSTLLGQKIRQFLLDGAAPVPMAELLMFCAARAEFTETVLKPLIAEKPNAIIFCDRFYDSTLAYQGYGRQIDLRKVEEIVQRTCADVSPDLTLFLDIAPEKALVRRGDAGSLNRLDQESLDFHQRVYAGYKYMSSVQYTSHTWRRNCWLVINADRPQDIVCLDAFAVVWGKYLTTKKERSMK